MVCLVASAPRAGAGVRVSLLPPQSPVSPQGVVSQQDSYIEDQKLLLTERALTRSSSRPSSLIEQEKQRSLEKQRQDLANLQRQQAQHLEEKRRREREWEAREGALQEREARLAQREAEVRRGQQDLDRDRDELQQKKGAYQYDLERLRAAQRQLEREQEQLKRDAERLSQRQMERDACQVRSPGPGGARCPCHLGLVTTDKRRTPLCPKHREKLSGERKPVLQNVFFYTKGAGEGVSLFLLFARVRGRRGEWKCWGLELTGTSRSREAE